MSHHGPRLLHLPPTQPHARTHLQTRPRLPSHILGRDPQRLRHALEPRDQHALHQTLVHHLLHERRLLFRAPALGGDQLVFEDEDLHRVVADGGAADEFAAGVELGAQRLGAVAQLADHLGAGLQGVDHVAGDGGEHGGQRGGEGVGGGGDALMFDDVVAAGAEAAAGAERAGQTADDHVDEGRVDVLVFGEAAAGAAENAVGEGFFEDEPEFVLEFEVDEGREVGDVADVFEEAFGDDEATRQGSPGLFTCHALEHALEIRIVVVVVPFDGAAGDLDALARGVGNSRVADDDVAAFGEGGDDRGHRGEGLRVHDTGGDAEVGGDVGFGFHVHVLRAVEAGRGAGPDAVGFEGCDGLFFQVRLVGQVVEVERGEIGDGAAVGEFGFRGGGSA